MNSLADVTRWRSVMVESVLWREKRECNKLTAICTSLHAAICTLRAHNCNELVGSETSIFVYQF